MKKKLLIGLLAIIMCISITGCGNSSNSDNGSEKENNAEEKEKKDEKDKEEIDFEIKEEEGKVIIKLTEDLVYVYYHDGEKVTDFEIYLGSSTHEDALSLLEVSKKAAESTEEVDWIDVKGRYVIYNYNEKGFNGITTYEELREFAKAYNIILDANNKKTEEDTIEWPTMDYPRPDNCILVRLEPNAAGVKLVVKWNSAEDVANYKKLLASKYDVTFYTTEGDGINNNNFIGKEISLFYSKTDESQNYILFNEQ